MQQQPGAQEPDNRSGTRRHRPRCQRPCCAHDFGKAAVSSDSVAGMMNAAPTPATARATMICVGLSNRPSARTTPTAKMTSPTSSAPRRPYRSPIAPGGQQQACQHQGVAVDDPGQLRLRGRGLQRDVGQRGVERDHRRDDQQHAEARDDQQSRPGPDLDRVGRRWRRYPGQTGRGCRPWAYASFGGSTFETNSLGSETDSLVSAVRRWRKR